MMCGSLSDRILHGSHHERTPGKGGEFDAMVTPLAGVRHSPSGEHVTVVLWSAPASRQGRCAAALSAAPAQEAPAYLRPGLSASRTALAPAFEQCAIHLVHDLPPQECCQHQHLRKWDQHFWCHPRWPPGLAVYCAAQQSVFVIWWPSWSTTTARVWGGRGGLRRASRPKVGERPRSRVRRARGWCGPWISHLARRRESWWSR